MTLVLKATEPGAIEEAARLIRAGKLVALPTETVYGLGANALDARAVAGIFVAKGRPTFNPLIVHVLGEEQARALSPEWTEIAAKLARTFWPGPLSLVVKKRPEVPDEVTGGGPTVALRAPAHPVARAVIAAAGVPIAAPSANRSNAISPTTAEHVLRSLGGRIDAVLDAGPCEVGIESTVVDATGSPVLLRPGGVSVESIESVVGHVSRTHAIDESGARPSPGMLARHYAPDAETMLFDAPSLHTVLESLPASARIGVLSRQLPRSTDARLVAWEALGDDPARFAHHLYAALHRIEAAGATHVLIERLPEGGGWAAVADRLTRAAGKRD